MKKRITSIIRIIHAFKYHYFYKYPLITNIVRKLKTSFLELLCLIFLPVIGGYGLSAFHKDLRAITAVTNQKGIGFYEPSIRVGRPGTKLGRGDGDAVTCSSNLCIASETCLKPPKMRNS